MQVEGLNDSRQREKDKGWGDKEANIEVCLTCQSKDNSFFGHAIFVNLFSALALQGERKQSSDGCERDQVEASCITPALPPSGRGWAEECLFVVCRSGSRCPFGMNLGV
jgi:hypothetical protein